MPSGKVSAIAPLANTVPGAAANGRPDMNLGYPGSNNFTCLLLVNLIISVNNGFPSFGFDHFTGRQPTDYSLSK